MIWKVFERFPFLLHIYILLIPLAFFSNADHHWADNRIFKKTCEIHNFSGENKKKTVISFRRLKSDFKCYSFSIVCSLLENVFFFSFRYYCCCFDFGSMLCVTVLTWFFFVISGALHSKKCATFGLLLSFQCPLFRLHESQLSAESSKTKPSPSRRWKTIASLTVIKIQTTHNNKKNLPYYEVYFIMPGRW